MSQLNRSRAFLRPRLFVGLILSAFVGLAALAGLGSLSGCKAVDIGTTPTDTGTITYDSAQISVSNLIDQDAGTITFLLFPPNTVEITNAPNVTVLGTVTSGSTRRFRVPVGKWKLAFEDRGGNRVAMEDVNAATGEWVKSVFVKNGDYALILKTEVNETQWIPNYSTEPKFQ